MALSTGITEQSGSEPQAITSDRFNNEGGSIMQTNSLTNHHSPQTRSRLLAAALALILLIVAIAAPAASAQEDVAPDHDEVHLPGDLVVDPSTLTVPATRMGGAAGTTTANETQSAGNVYQLRDSVSNYGTEDFGCAAPWNLVVAHNPAGSNNGEFNVAIPFGFEFYSSTYHDLTVGVNGGILMGANAGDLDSANQSLASNAKPGIFPFWDDLQFDSLNLFNSIYTCVEGSSPTRVFKIMWFNVDCVGCIGADAESISFEAALHEFGDEITFTYSDTAFATGNSRNHGASATIGIDSGIGGHLQYSRNQDAITENPMTITFYTSTCAGHEATIVGTRSGGTIHGTNGDDVIFGHVGGDNIRSYGGDDVICSGAGDDMIRAGDGNDFVYAGDGDDWIRGQAGHDDLSGFDGDDDMHGGSGDDMLRAGAGNDFVRGGSGADTLNGHEGDDDLRGNGGINTIRGFSGDDIIRGGGTTDIIDGGDGNDVIDGNGGSDAIEGGKGHDTINGNGGPDLLSGGNGHDIINGGNGADELNGNGGDDVLNGGGNNDDFIGGAGNDTCNGNGGSGDEHVSGCVVITGIEVL